MISKKGISGVVSAVFVVIVSMALASAVGIIFIHYSSAQLSPQLPCTQIRINQPVIIDNANYNAETKNVEVRIKRPLESIPFNTLDFSFDEGSTTHKSSCSFSCGSCEILAPGATKVYYLPAENPPATLTLSVNSCVLENKPIS